MAKSKREIQQEYEKRTGYSAQVKYKHENIKQIALHLNKKTDADILEKLNNVTNKTGYIKELIRADIDSNKD